MSDQPATLSLLGLPVDGELRADVAEPELETRPCEVCADPVGAGDRWEVLRADGPHWRHPWHTEPI